MNIAAIPYFSLYSHLNVIYESVGMFNSYYIVVYG